MKVVLGPKFPARWKSHLPPPRSLRGAKEPGFGWSNVVPVQDTMQAIAGLGAPIDQAPTVGDQSAQFSHVNRRNPDGGDQSSRE